MTYLPSFPVRYTIVVPVPFVFHNIAAVRIVRAVVPEMDLLVGCCHKQLGFRYCHRRSASESDVDHERNIQQVAVTGIIGDAQLDVIIPRVDILVRRVAFEAVGLEAVRFVVGEVPLVVVDVDIAVVVGRVVEELDELSVADLGLVAMRQGFGRLVGVDDIDFNGLLYRTQFQCGHDECEFHICIGGLLAGMECDRFAGVVREESD